MVTFRSYQFISVHISFSSASGEPVSVSVGAADSTVDLSQLSPGSSYEVNVISLLNLDESDPLKDTAHTRTFIKALPVCFATV